MPRDGAITFRDIAGKLAVLRVACDKCGRSGQYRVDRLIMRYGLDAKLFERSPRPIVRARWRGTNTTRAAPGARTSQRRCEALRSVTTELLAAKIEILPRHAVRHPKSDPL